MHLPFAVASSVLRPRQLLEKEEVGRARLLVIEMRGRDSDRDLPKCNGRSFLHTHSSRDSGHFPIVGFSSYDHFRVYLSALLLQSHGNG